MSLKLITSSIIAAFFFSFQACINPPDYPDRPDIEFVSVSTNFRGESNVTLTDTIDTFFINHGDSIVIKLSFKDGDGDIGYESAITPPCPDSLRKLSCNTMLCDFVSYKSLFLKDTRKEGCNFDFIPYEVPFVPAKGSSDAISGDIFVYVFSECFFEVEVGNYPAFDTLIYYINLIDRAGNSSDTIRAPMIIIDCP